jgi:hypothetical protein
LAKPKRNYYFPRPTSSNESGLVAHYVFSPETIQGGQLLDISGEGNDGTIDNCLITLDGLKANGTGGSVSLGNIGTVKTIACRVKLDSTTEQILEGAANDKLILVNAGTLTASDYSTLYVNGAVGTSVSADKWHDIVITDSTGVSNTAVTLALNDTSYGAVEFADLRFYSDEKDATWVKSYHNQWVRPYLIDDFSDSPADGTTVVPEGWRSGTGVVKCGEITTYVNHDLNVGTKYMEFTTAGTVLFPISLDSLPNNGYISYWYYNGSSWSERTGLIDAPVTGVAYASGVLTFTGADIGDRIAKISVETGQKV